HKYDAGVTLAGILPTLRTSHLTLEHMTPNPRYAELNRAITEARDGAFNIQIKGIDELDITHDNVMLEAANTSFQIHFQVAPAEFAKLYNLAQLISAPVLAAAVNSPLLLGQRLWSETRVALFQRSVDSRSSTQRRRAKPARVSFGDKWIESSILEIYKDDISRFRVMLSTSELERDPLQLMAEGEIPSLRALRMHTGTVWRWNRGCYGIYKGRPHLRIENRILPAGPSVLDEVANAAFFYGLMAAMADQYPDVHNHLEFDDAKSNFFSAAQQGLQARIVWPGGQTHTAEELILQRLLPDAREGLKNQGIESADIDRYLGTVEERVRTRQTGSQWALRSLSRMTEAPKDVRLRSLTRAMYNNQQSGKPVHEWPPAELYRTRDWFPSYRTVGQFMSTDLFTVRPSDPVDLAARMMDWRQIRHVPVEDDHGKLVGLLSFRDLLRLVAQGRPGPDEEIQAQDCMRRNPMTVRADTPTLEALEFMQDKNIGSLPVVDDDDRLIGLVTVYDLLEIAGKVLEDFLRGEDQHGARSSLIPPPPRLNGRIDTDNGMRDAAPVTTAQLASRASGRGFEDGDPG
ncbi:MAG: CBS domain-containing protein, partial [Myxococcota bacterium]